MRLNNGQAGSTTLPTDTPSMPPDYPRPLLRRKNWESLNGLWDFEMDPEHRWQQPSQVSWSQRILVPFAPETSRSGIGFDGFCRAFWYRRQFRARVPADERLLLHFEAVDYRATVWVNGKRTAQHDGGYTPFVCDISSLLKDAETQEIIVLAEDDPADLTKPRGKQDWQLKPHSIWYPRTSGIWRTVWLERVPRQYIRSLVWAPNRERWEIGMEVHIDAEQEQSLLLEVKLSSGAEVLAHDTYSVISCEVYRRVALSDPGIDDFRNELLWSPEHPTLIDASLKLKDASGATIDEVESYTALRSVGIQGNRFVLNGRPLRLQMVLDQGYWPDTGATPPNDDALRKDIELVKAMGFNGARKHQKLEDARYLYWADKLGLLVWEEMPSAYRYTRSSIHQLVKEWMEVMERDLSHPCIVAWVPFNESWGVPDLPDSAAQRHYVQALYHLTKTIDSTRPVVGNDGWESVATDLIGVHDYDPDPARITARYGSHDAESHLLTRERPGGRLLILGEPSVAAHPLILSEFGGIALSGDEAATWGYSRCATPEELRDRFRDLIAAVRASPFLAGYCYTQFTDTYQETNGLLHADRTPKISIEEIAEANLDTPLRDGRADSIWRARLMELQHQIAKLTEETHS